MLLSGTTPAQATFRCRRPSESKAIVASSFTLRWNRRRACSTTRVTATVSDVIVVGAGAAGLTAAYFAANEGAQVKLQNICALHANSISEVLTQYPPGC